MAARRPLSRGAGEAIVVTLLLSACFLLAGGLLADDDLPPEWSKVVERDGIKYRVDLRPRQIAYWKREVGKDEIRTSRGKVEDELRRRVLEVFIRRDRLEKLRGILNRPWDKEGIEYLWSLVFQYERNSRENVAPLQKSRILDLLAYVSTKYPHSKEAALIRTKFDHLLLNLSDPNAKPRVCSPSNRYKFCATVMNAIMDYGSAELLGPGFWRCFEGYRDAGASCRAALRKVGDAKALERLKRYGRDLPLPVWARENRNELQFLEDTIKAMEERLAKEKETPK